MSITLNVAQRRRAALTDSGVVFVFADMDGVIPATLTFLAVGLPDFHGQT
jgi:hypothetical protein